MLLQMVLFVFLWLSSIPLYICTIFFVHSSANGHLGCFYVLAIMNSCCYEDRGVHVLFQIKVLLGYMSRTGIARSYGSSVCRFLRNLHTSCIYLHPHQQYRRPGFDPWVGMIPWRRKWLTDSSILAWKISWTQEPGGLQSMGLQRVGHD